MVNNNMHDIKAEEKIPIKMSLHERELVLKNHLLDPDITGHLELSQIQGTFITVYYTPAELSLLLKVIADEATKTIYPKIQRDLNRLHDRISLKGKPCITQLDS